MNLLSYCSCAADEKDLAPNIRAALPCIAVELSSGAAIARSLSRMCRIPLIFSRHTRLFPELLLLERADVTTRHLPCFKPAFRHSPE
jgi:hypothetical protein